MRTHIAMLVWLDRNSIPHTQKKKVSLRLPVYAWYSYSVKTVIVSQGGYWSHFLFLKIKSLKKRSIPIIIIIVPKFIPNGALYMSTGKRGKR